MSENIELRSNSNLTFTVENEIEEYHEINHELMETSFTSEKSVKTINEYEFFTQADVKAIVKHKGGKGKKHKREKAANLMDIITSELASLAAPIEENVIFMVDYSAAQQNSYLEEPSKLPRILRKFSSQGDAEHGWQQNVVNLNPVYPKIFENTAVEQQDNDIPVEYIHPMKFMSLINDTENSKIKQLTKFLDIEIKGLTFKHHHQFSLEKLLSVKLDDFYKDYVTTEQKLKDLSIDVKILRETKDNLKKDFLKASPNKKDTLRFDNTLRKYTGQLFESKEKYFEVFQEHDEIIHKIISIWLDMETIREKKKIVETPHILEITRIKLSKDEYTQEWNEMFNTEFNDRLDKIEYDFVTKYLEYKKAKHEENKGDSTRRKISKPKLEINEDSIKEEVQQVVNKILTRDKINLSLKYDKEVISDSGDGKNAPLYKYFFEIYVDDLFVCESESITLKNSVISDIEFHDSLTLEILPKNYNLSLILFENSSEISSLKIQLDEVKRSIISSHFVTERFILNEIIGPTSKHVGCGHSIKEIAAENKIRLRSSNIFKGNLYTTAEVDIRIGWNATLGQNENETIKSYMEIGKIIKRLLHGLETPNIETIINIINKVYNIDISNDEAIIKALRNICKTTLNVQDTFPVNENSPEFVRIKLLHLRNTGRFSNIENKIIPIHPSQISTEQLNCLQNSQENDVEAQYYKDKYTEMDPIELQRLIGSRYVQKLNKNVQINLNEHLMKKTHKDVVRDMSFSLKSFFSKQPSANFVSTSSKQQHLKEGIVKMQEIRVMVARAFNLPERRASLVEDEHEEMIAGYKVHPLRPFVKISYRGCSSQTGTGIGCHPTWNQTLELHTRLDPLSSVHISVLDEPRDEHSGGESSSHRRSRWLGELAVPLSAVLSLGSLRGTFKISTPPLSFGYENSPKEKPHSLLPDIINLMKKDAAFISLYITTSLSGLGGLQEYNQPNSDDDYLIKHLNNFVTSFVNDFPNRSISLTYIDSSGKNKCVTQFLQPIPLPNSECWPRNPRNRSESALSKSSGFSKDSLRRDEMNITPSHSGEEKESLYSAGSFRSGENQITKLMYAILRYVALIPTYENTETHTVTLMGLELLKVLHGSALDHALLLTSYFLYLGVRCYVAVGLGLPRGNTAFVLTKYDHVLGREMLIADQEKSHRLSRSGHTWHVYDAVTGERTELRDVGCPMKTVLYVFDTDNIWVNSQNSQDVQNVSFDLKKSSDWQPVFDKSVFLMKQPTVSESGLYTTCGDVERLRATIENKIRDKIQRWRPHHKTIWNRYCSVLLKDMLPQWEYWAFNSTEPKPAPSQKLKQLMLTYKMFGFPLNMPYVSLKSVLNTVKSTGVHVCDDPNAEFALAVQVYPYPNNVISVWLFVASITRL